MATPHTRTRNFETVRAIKKRFHHNYAAFDIIFHFSDLHLIQTSSVNLFLVNVHCVHVGAKILIYMYHRAYM